MSNQKQINPPVILFQFLQIAKLSEEIFIQGSASSPFGQCQHLQSTLEENLGGYFSCNSIWVRTQNRRRVTRRRLKILSKIYIPFPPHQRGVIWRTYFLDGKIKAWILEHKQSFILSSYSVVSDSTHLSDIVLDIFCRNLSQIFLVRYCTKALT